MKSLRLPLLLFLPAAFLLSGPPAHPQPAPAPSVEANRKALNEVFNDYWDDRLKHDPEFASSIGDKRWNDQIGDYSVAAFNARLEREQNFLMRLADIDMTGLQNQEKNSRDLLLRQFTEDQEAAAFKEWEMPIDQRSGFYLDYPQLAAQLTFTEVKDYDDWIARLHAIPHAFDQVSTNMAIGIEDHRVPPKFLLKEALDEVNTLAHQKPEDSPLALPLKKFPASIPAAEQERIKDEMLHAIDKEVLPAYLRFARFLEVSYVPAGRDEPGLSALPDGKKYYAFLIRRITTTQLTAEQIHQIGLDEVKRDEAEMLTIAQKLGFADLKTFRAGLKTNPKLKPASREALLDAYRGYLGPMQAKLPLIFGRLPKAKFEVVPVPDFMEKSAAPAYYEHPSPDGSRPAVFSSTPTTPRTAISTPSKTSPTTKAFPAITCKSPSLWKPKACPLSANTFTTRPIPKAGDSTPRALAKTSASIRTPTPTTAASKVISGALYGWWWTRAFIQRAGPANRWSTSSTTTPTSTTPVSRSEVDRYIATPAQALAYKVGQLTILQLRQRAQKTLGAKFDLRAFHDQIVDAGALPLDVLSDRIDAWIATQASAAAASPVLAGAK
jgi:uncharacterized protein (DUF885 family)